MRSLRSTLIAVFAFATIVAVGFALTLYFDSLLDAAHVLFEQVKTHPVRYITDDRTHLCFAVSRSQPEVGVALVPCTDAVVTQALKDAY